MNGVDVGFHVREFGFRGLPIARPAIIRELPFLDKLAIIGNPCAAAQIGGQAGVVHNPIMANIMMYGRPSAKHGAKAYSGTGIFVGCVVWSSRWA